MNRIILLLCCFIILIVSELKASTLNVTNYGAWGDTRLLTVVCTTNSFTVTGTNTYTAGDVGKILSITAAGNITSSGATNWFDLVAQIQSINNGTNAVLNRAVQHTTNTLAWFGTCCSTGLQTAINTAVAGDTISIPVGRYLVIPPVWDTNWMAGGRFSDPAIVISKSGISLVGDSQTGTLLMGNGAFQLSSGAVYRGPTFKGEGPFTNSPASTLNFATLTIDGGVTVGYLPECIGCFPANTITGKGWDITHDAFQWFGSSTPLATNTVWNSVTFQHYRGEMLKQNLDDASAYNDTYRATNCIFRDGNATAWNIPNAGYVHGCVFSNLIQVAEINEGEANKASVWEFNTASNCQSGIVVQGALTTRLPQASFTIQSNNMQVVSEAVGVGPAQNVFLIGNVIHDSVSAMSIGASGAQGNAAISNILFIGNFVTNCTIVISDEASSGVSEMNIYASNNIVDSYTAFYFGYLHTNIFLAGNTTYNGIRSIDIADGGASGSQFIFCGIHNLFPYFAGTDSGGTNAFSYVKGAFFSTASGANPNYWKLSNESRTPLNAQAKVLCGFTEATFISGTNSSEVTLIPQGQQITVNWNGTVWSTNAPTPPPPVEPFQIILGIYRP